MSNTLNLSNNTRILTAKELLFISEREIGSSLVSVNKTCPTIVSYYKKMDMLPYTGDELYVRDEVAHMLNKALIILKNKSNSELNFFICYGYRHPDIQKQYFEKRYTEHRIKNPTLLEFELIEKTHMQVAYPDVAGHPTGGAIDITLVDINGKEVDMGTKIADYSIPDKCLTFSKNITIQQNKNRMLLRDCLMEVGFAPFNGEWWHFSYGDREWACFYGKSSSNYKAIAYKKAAHV